VTAASARNERLRKRKRLSSAPRWQHPFQIEDTNWHRGKQLLQECGWKRGDSAIVNSGKDGQIARLPLVGARISQYSDLKNLSFEEDA